MYPHTYMKWYDEGFNSSEVATSNNMNQAIWKHFSCHFCRMCQMFAFLLRVFCQNRGFQPLFLPAYPSVFPFWICLSLSVYVCAVMATFPAPGVILRFPVSDQFIISSWLTHLPFITQSTKVDIPQFYINSAKKVSSPSVVLFRLLIHCVTCLICPYGPGSSLTHQPLTIACLIISINIWYFTCTICATCVNSCTCCCVLVAYSI